MAKTLTPKEATKLKPHPLAASWPRRDAGSFASLKASLKSSIGQERPIVIMGNQIIDGIERTRALIELDKPVAFETYDGPSTDAAILQKIIALNSERGTSKSQKAMLAARALPTFEKIVAEQKREQGRAAAEKQRGRVPAKMPEPSGEARALVAELFDVGDRYVSDAKALNEADPKLADEVLAGKLKLAEAKRQLSSKVKAKEWKRVALATPELPPEDYKVLVGDSGKQLKKLADGSFDLVFADPPYGIGDDYHGFNDKLTATQLMAGIAPVMAECVRLLKPTGALWLMMSSRYAIETGLLLQRLGLHRQEMIIWAESFGPHNSKFHSDCYRVIHLYTKHPSKFTFNWEDERTYIPSWRIENDDPRGVVGGKLTPNVWGVWTDKKVHRVPDNARERIPKGRIKAPNQLPVRLLERIVLLTSNAGDAVLDPFHGTGTTAVACQLHQRHYTGCELSPDVAEASRGWIKARVALFKEHQS